MGDRAYRQLSRHEVTSSIRQSVRADDGADGVAGEGEGTVNCPSRHVVGMCDLLDQDPLGELLDDPLLEL
jgi:hypothetical protein